MSYKIKYSSREIELFIIFWEIIASKTNVMADDLLDTDSTSK